MTQIEAPVSRYKKNNYLIWAVALIGLAAWFAYDGYANQTFIEEHTTEDGTPNATLKFNRVAPPFLVVGGLVMGSMVLVIRNRKVVAAEETLQINDKTISYEQIEKVDKTHFDKKGYFTFTWMNADQKEQEMKLSDRDYDNLGPVLDRIIEKIS